VTSSRKNFQSSKTKGVIGNTNRFWFKTGFYKTVQSKIANRNQIHETDETISEMVWMVCGLI